MSSVTQASIPYADYCAYKLARILADALSCGELVAYQIHKSSTLTQAQIRGKI